MARKQVLILWGPGYTKKLYASGEPATPVQQAEYLCRVHDLFGSVEMEARVGDSDYGTPHDLRSKQKERPFTMDITVRGLAGTFDTYFWDLVDNLKKALYNFYSGRQNPVRVVVQRGAKLVYITARLEYMEEEGNGKFVAHMKAWDGVFTLYTTDTNRYGSGVAGIDVDDGGTGYVVPPTVQIEGGGGSGATAYALLDAGHVSRIVVSNMGLDYTSTPSVTISPPPAGDPASGLPVLSSIAVGATGNTGVPPDIYVAYPGSAPSDPSITFTVGGAGNVWQFRHDFSVRNNSPVALVSQPICLDLGNISSLVTSGYMFTTNVNGEERPKDLRVESFGGARKMIYIRCSGTSGAGTLTCKVWFVMYHMAPGEVKYMRLLFGNPYAVYEAENSGLKPMFNAYSSSNAVWSYGDFAPRYDREQSRSAQWTPHTPGRRNLSYIDFPHPGFTLSGADATLVPCAGGRTARNAAGAGYCGLQLTTNIAISSVVHDYKKSANYRAVFVMRSQKQNGQWTDDFTDGEDVAQRVRLAAGSSGSTLVVDPNYSAMLSAWKLTLVNSTAIRIELDDNTVYNTTVSSIDSILNRITIAGTLPSAASAGRAAYQYKNYGDRTQSYPSGLEPRTIMFGLRVDRPDLNLAETVYAGVEHADVTFLAAERPLIMWSNLAGTRDSNGNFTMPFATSQRFDMTDIAHGYQLNGRIYNAATGVGLPINTVLRYLFDKLIIDCAERTATYLQYAPAVGAPPTVMSVTAQGAQTYIVVNSASLYAAGDPIYVGLNDGGYHLTEVQRVSGNTIYLADPLPCAAGVGRAVGRWESRVEALDLISDGIRDYWLRLDPGQSGNTLSFSPGGGMNNITVNMWWPVRYF